MRFVLTERGEANEGNLCILTKFYDRKEKRMSLPEIFAMILLGICDIGILMVLVLWFLERLKDLRK